MMSTLRRVWQWLDATFWDTCIHEAAFVSADGQTGTCRTCGRTYPYRPYYGHYPGFDVDLNMPTEDPRRYAVRQPAMCDRYVQQAKHQRHRDSTCTEIRYYDSRRDHDVETSH